MLLLDLLEDGFDRFVDFGLLEQRLGVLQLAQLDAQSDGVGGTTVLPPR